VYFRRETEQELTRASTFAHFYHSNGFCIIRVCISSSSNSGTDGHV
jgi:hypothetical protein